MPQNTPMKRQFTTIDGRTVMSNLPQHWGGNDWKITGVDNPLPVGNYVQTEAGVWIPQKGSDDGAADVRLTGSYVVNGFEEILSKIGTIPPGASAVVEVDLLNYGFPINSITLIGRNDSGEPIEIRVRNKYLLPSGHWSSTVYIEDVIFPSSNSVGIKTTRYEPLSQKQDLIIRNNGTVDVKLTSLAVMFWR